MTSVIPFAPPPPILYRGPNDSNRADQILILKIYNFRPDLGVVSIKNWIMEQSLENWAETQKNSKIA